MKYRFLRGLFAFAVATLLCATPVQAAKYGDGTYGACSVSVGCPANTVVETKAGLEVAINLTNGQVLPADGYLVKVTPLNGQGSSFAYVQFYVDNVLLSTFYPDNTGTATWQWDTAVYKGTQVKVVIYDTEGAQITKDFTVSIAKPGTKTTDPINNIINNESVASPSDPVGQFVAFLQNTVRAIPAPIAFSIPYILLLALLIIIMLLFMQSRREAIAAKRLRASLQRARQLAEEKSAFIQLASHYLRTPLTLISGGADFFTVLKPPVDPAILKRLAVTVGAFGMTIEDLLTKTGNDQRLQGIADTSDLPKIRPIWVMPAFWWPLVLVGLLVVGFNALLFGVDKLDFFGVGALTQAALFAVLAVALCMVLRWQALVRRDRRQANQQEQQQIAIDEARNGLIREASETLAQKLGSIKEVIPQLPDGKAKQFVQDGCDRINEVLERFKATATVIPPVTSMAFTPFGFSELLNKAQTAVAATAQAKKITFVQITSDVELASQQPAWISQTLSAVLDNAVAYSSEGSRVDVSAVAKDGVACISVQDYGVGIAEDKLAELFQPFSKAEGPLQFDHPGIGLSLYLSRLLLTNLSGSITITSQPKQGTRVDITFPTRYN